MDIESVADLFYARTGKQYLYNITAIDNVSSIIRHGIVCHDYAKRICHYSIAMEDVQERRSQKSVPNGLRIHQYANLYFSFRNPMMYKRKDLAEDLCILVLSASVLNIDECIVSDMNAAAGLVRFYSAAEGMGALDFNRIYAKSWIHPGDDNETRIHKLIKCAEILIPYAIPFSYVKGAYAVNSDSRDALERAGFRQRVEVNSSVFFR